MKRSLALDLVVNSGPLMGSEWWFSWLGTAQCVGLRVCLENLEREGTKQDSTLFPSLLASLGHFTIG